VKLEQAVSKAGISDGDQVEVAIKLKVPKLHFQVTCKNPDVKMDFDTKVNSMIRRTLNG
jgi:hypothetical protein